MIENLLEFGGGFHGFAEFQICQAAHILRTELGCSFISGGGLQQLERTVGALEPYFMQLRIQDRAGDA